MVCLVDIVLIEVIRMQGFFEMCGFELRRGIFRWDKEFCLQDICQESTNLMYEILHVRVLVVQLSGETRRKSVVEIQI